SFLPTGGSPKAGDKETTPNNQGSGPPAPTPWPKNGGRLWRDAEVDQSRRPHCNMRHRGTASSLEPQLNCQKTPFRYVRLNIRVTPESRAKRDSHVRYVPKADMPLHSRRCRLVL